MNSSSAVSALRRAWVITSVGIARELYRGCGMEGMRCVGSFSRASVATRYWKGDERIGARFYVWRVSSWG